MAFLLSFLPSIAGRRFCWRTPRTTSNRCVADASPQTRRFRSGSLSKARRPARQSLIHGDDRINDGASYRRTSPSSRTHLPISNKDFIANMTGTSFTPLRNKDPPTTSSRIIMPQAHDQSSPPSRFTRRASRPRQVDRRVTWPPWQSGMIGIQQPRDGAAAKNTVAGEAAKRNGIFHREHLIGLDGANILPARCLPGTSLVWRGCATWPRGHQVTRWRFQVYALESRVSGKRPAAENKPRGSRISLPDDTTMQWRSKSNPLACGIGQVSSSTAQRVRRHRSGLAGWPLDILLQDAKPE
ncbi:hypothetical protein EV126DRAFT_119637 [Verticillium dahliae]|nr:hypothetical protein EV126DRAFT_119637 [Verticillium dahliae]